MFVPSRRRHATKDKSSPLLLQRVLRFGLGLVGDGSTQEGRVGHWNHEGQDGAYLAELLLKKGYVVHGIKRRTSLFNTARIDHLYQDPHVDNRQIYFALWET